MSSKTKYYKKVFQENADCVKDNTVVTNPVPVMSQEIFICTAGEIEAKAKNKYYKKRLSITFAFAEWCCENYTQDFRPYVWNSKSDKTFPLKAWTTEELFEIWKQQNK